MNKAYTFKLNYKYILSDISISGILSFIRCISNLVNIIHTKVTSVLMHTGEGFTCASNFNRYLLHNHFI